MYYYNDTLVEIHITAGNFKVITEESTEHCWTQWQNYCQEVSISVPVI